MRLKQISILLQLFLINMLLMLGSTSASTFAVETDSVAQDFSAITDESASDRKSPNILVDNVYYEEELMVEIWRDGSEKSVWKLEDSGNDLLAFPTTLPTPLNSSYPGVQDMRIDLLVSEVPQLSAEGGLMADFDQFADDSSSSNSETSYGDADYASFSSNEILVTLRVWNETVNNSGILYDGLNDSQKLIEDTINDLSLALGTTFHLMTNRSGIYWEMQNDYGIEQSWRAFLFDMNDAWNALFSVLPLNEGLTATNTSRLMQADARSLYLVAEWDEKPDRDWTTDVDGSGQDEEDERWEFETMFGILEKEKLALNASSNQIFFNELMDFDQIQYSHLKANASSITVRLPYGSRIDNIEPYDSRNINGICYFGLDLVGYHTRRVIEYDSVTFTLDALPMPSLLLHATTNATVVSPGDIVQIDYNLTNIGNAPAYNAFLWGFDNDSGPETDWNFINVTQGNFNYTYWDPASDRNYFDFGQIDAGESAVHSVILNATPPGNLWNQTFISDSWVDYSGDPTTGTPTGWIQTAIRNWGNDLGFWYNHSDVGPELNVKVQLANSTVAVGENFTISAKMTNTGNKTAYSIDWWAPFQLNITNRNGIIESLAPGASVIVNTTYLVDAASPYITDSTRDEAPTRQLGSTFDFYETGRSDLGGGYDYTGWFINQYDDNVTTFTSNIWGSEIKLDVLPASNQTLGPFLTVNVQHSADTIPRGEKTTVSITVANVGSTAAENVAINSEFSDSEFTFYAGAGTISGGQGSAQARRFTYNWGTLAPGDSLSFSYRLEAQTNATIYTHTYAVVDWDAFTGFGGLTRTFYPRTYDWEEPTIAGPEDLEIFRNKTTATTDNLTWSLSDEHSGMYRILRANSSSAISSDNASAISAANLTFVEVASGRWTNATPKISYSLAGANDSGLTDGFYLFTFVATDYSGHSANDTVAVAVTTVCPAIILDGPADLEIIREETAAITANLTWSLSAEDPGTYRILRAKASTAISSDEILAILAANLTFVEVASGDVTSATPAISHSLSGLDDGFYLFTLLVTDYCGNSANDTVVVAVTTTPADEGLIEDFTNFLADNAPLILIFGVLAVAVIVEGAVIYMMRK